MADGRSEPVTRREFDRLECQVEDQRRELTLAALDIREIKTVQAGTREIPTWEEAKAELPEMIWP